MGLPVSRFGSGSMSSGKGAVSDALIRGIWAFRSRPLLADRLPDQAERVAHGRHADVTPADIAETADPCRPRPAGDRRNGQVHQSNGFLGSPTSRAGDAGDGDGKVGRRAAQRARGHGARDLRAHRAVAKDEIEIDAEHADLGGIRIGHEAPVDDVRGSGNLGERRRDEPAGATLGRSQLEPARPSSAMSRPASSIRSAGNMAAYPHAVANAKKARRNSAPLKLAREAAQGKRPALENLSNTLRPRSAALPAAAIRREWRGYPTP